MTKEKAKQMAEVLNAYAEGKPIEVLVDGEWGEVDLNEYSFDESESYRIKKEPKYRPFKNVEECFNEMQKHEPLGWVCFISDKVSKYYQVTSIEDVNVRLEDYETSFEESLKDLHFVDGEPFGIKE